VLKGDLLPNDESCVEAFGINYRAMDSVLGEGQTDLLFDKAYQIIYGFNSGK